jgi:erythromycin esterase-like protein
MRWWKATVAYTVLLLLSAGEATAEQVGREAGGAEVLAEHALPLRFDLDSPGLQELTSLIGDARIVLLGEPWHGDGAAIRLRAELVQWLHREMDFDVVAFESDFYSLNRGWQRVDSAADVHAFAAANLYPFWSTAAAIQPLWDYIAARHGTDRPLDVAGLDVRHTGSVGEAELPARIDSLLAGIADIDDTRRRGFRATLERFLAQENPDAPPPEVQQDFYRILDAADRRLTFTDSDAPLLHREIRNLRNAARYSWSGANRDAFMGENFRWVAGELYPDRKIIVWAHNNHIIEDKWMYFAAPDSAIRHNLAGRSPGSIRGVTYLGTEIRDFAGPDVVSLATLTATGRYTPDIREATISDPAQQGRNEAVRAAPEGTLEAILAEHGPDVALVSFRGLDRGADRAITQALDYTQAPPRLMDWDRGYDGFLFVRETFPITEDRPVALPETRAGDR